VARSIVEDQRELSATRSQGKDPPQAQAERQSERALELAEEQKAAQGYLDALSKTIAEYKKG
jgi:hypothetical protein